MPPGQTIDFTREDFGGVWLLFVCFALLALTTLKKTDLVGGGFRKAGRAILVRMIIGALIASPLLLFLAIWQRLPPRQYFINLRLEPERIVLGYRWPEPEKAILIKDLTAVLIVNERRLRRSCSRVRVETTTETYRSFGFGRLSDSDEAIWRKLKSMVEQFRQHLTSPAVGTNNHSSAPLP